MPECQIESGVLDAGHTLDPNGIAAKKLGEEIRDERKRRGLSQGELADRASNGLYCKAISEIERGRQWPTVPQLKAIAHILDVDVKKWLILHTYYVVFEGFNKTGRLIIKGSREIVRTKPICSMQDVVEIQEYLKDNYYPQTCSLLVTFYNLLRSG